jgi:hypothetical protein
MRLQTLCFIGALAVAALPLSAEAQSSPANGQWTANSQAALPENDQPPANALADSQAVPRCPPGYDWEPAGYLGGGKWHPAFCGSRNQTIGF